MTMNKNEEHTANHTSSTEVGAPLCVCKSVAPALFRVRERDAGVLYQNSGLNLVRCSSKEIACRNVPIIFSEGENGRCDGINPTESTVSLSSSKINSSSGVKGE